MQPVHLFNLAFDKADWLSVRQATVAENIANANTPAYRTREIVPFETTMQRTELALATTSPGHFALVGRPAHATPENAPRAGFGGAGNDVSLEKELIKAGEVSRDYSLSVSIVKSFHRMWMASLKG